MRSLTNESDFNIDNGVYVVKFWATWCQPCKIYEPTIEKLDSEYNAKSVKFLSVDIDQVAVLAQKFKIKSLPTLIVFKDGLEVSRIVGVSLITPIRKEINTALNLNEVEEIVLEKENSLC